MYAEKVKNEEIINLEFEWFMMYFITHESCLFVVKGG